MSAFRRAVMAAMDNYHERTDGSNPEHIIVSRAVWRDMKTKSKFEKLGSTDVPKRRRESYGFMGMRVWPSGALDEKEEKFLILSEEMFREMLPVVADLRQSKGL